MSFPIHGQDYRFNGADAETKSGLQSIGIDESPICYSLASCSPVESRLRLTSWR